MIRAETFEKDFPHGKNDYEEPRDTPGASSLSEKLRISAIKVINVEM